MNLFPIPVPDMRILIPAFGKDTIVEIRAEPRDAKMMNKLVLIYTDHLPFLTSFPWEKHAGFYRSIIK